MVGSTFSHYTIIEKLGEGGMGVVYKAQDNTLDRVVALKFLPPHVSVSEETKARFLQEAKAAAALNHAHICTIHGVEEADDPASTGVAAGKKMFIVMEFIDGGTLRRKIPFQHVDDAVSAAIQIAEALQEAHAKEIVHRDIKADNVMLTSKGQVKVMDFGLAKLKGSLKLTRTSSTVGTLAYMAPEQIQGGEVDSRSDIFSFGALLFEMLTGKTPFRGEHEAAMLYSIVNEEPQSLEQLRADVPPLLAGLILKCLEKDPADRYQHMDDIVSELRRTQKKTSRVMRSSSYIPAQPPSPGAPTGPVPQSGLQAAQPAPTASTSRTMVYGIVGGAAIVILALAAWFFLKPSGISVNPNMTTRVLQVPFTQYSYPSLSPDGKWIAFPAADANGTWDIYYMHVGGGEPRKITSDATTFIQQSADISPDGGQIVYDRPNTAGTSYDIFSISALGGTSRLLAERASSAQWKPDGNRVGFIREPTDSHIRSTSRHVEFWTVGADGTDLRKEFDDTLFTARGNYRFNFCWSPDGKSVAWIRSLSPESQILLTHNLATGAERQLTAGNENIDAMRWTKDDRIIFSSNRGGNTNLWAVSANGGEAVQVTKGGGPDLALSIAASGNEMVCLQQQRVSHIWTANIDGSSPRQVTFDDREIVESAFSPDKRRIAFTMNDPDPLKVQRDVYVIDSDGNNRRRLTEGLKAPRIPFWSPDGSRLIYFEIPTGQGADTGKIRTYVLDVENPGPPKFAGNWVPTQWIDSDHFVSIDGRRSYITTISTATVRRFFTDSTCIVYFGNGRTVGYFDWHKAAIGWWVVNIKPTSIAELLNQPGDVLLPAVEGTPRKISSAPNFFTAYSSWPSAQGDMLQFAGEDKVRLISFSRGKEELLPGRFRGLRNASLDLSRDGKEIQYVAPMLNSRLVLLEHVFK